MRDVSRLFCIRCGGGHQSAECPTLIRVISDAPIETPPHNGPYQGTIPVRVIPPGAAGEAKVSTITDHARKSAGDHSRRRALANKLNCAYCGKEIPRNSRLHKYCNTSCRGKAGYYKYRDNAALNKRKTKWG